MSQYIDYPTAKFLTFEDCICAEFRGGARIVLAKFSSEADQEQYNLIKCLVDRASQAPELLAALEQAILTMSACRGCTDVVEMERAETMEQARVAIAKATGKL